MLEIAFNVLFLNVPVYAVSKKIPCFATSYPGEHFTHTRCSDCVVTTGVGQDAGDCGPRSIGR